MAEYIEREAAVNLILETLFTMSMCLSEQECHGMNRAKQIIARLVEQSIPAASVRENVTGEWIRKRSDYAMCPFCGYERKLTLSLQRGWIIPKFCEDCGADMRGAEDESM